MRTRSILGVFVLVAAAGAAGYAAYRLGVGEGMKMAAPAAGAASAAAETGQKSGERKVLYWQDPMSPGQRFDKPGKSPLMDMQLMPVYADEVGADGTTRVSPRVQQNLGVRTTIVATGTIGSAISAVGSIAYNDRDVAVVQARTAGFVERLHVRAPLDPVAKGQPLVDLYVPEWVAAQEEFFAVQRMQGRGIEPLVDAARQRMRLVGMTDEQIHAVEASGKVRPRFTITAPIGGVVTELTLREGMTVMAGASLFRINGTGTIWINADVPEALAAGVRPGAAVEVATPALPGKVFRGKVSRILPELNAQTRTVKARIELANPGGQLSPGMFATINFASGARRDVLLVPTEAVIQTGRRTVVIAALGDGRFAPVDVEIGAEADGRTEIRSGLAAGQTVVVSGQFLIDSEASLKATATRMSELPSLPPTPAALPASPASPPPPKAGAGPTHRGSGTVESIAGDEVMLSHGAIASLKWPAMTMGLRPPAAGLPKGIAVGDTVTFEFRQSAQGTYEIVAIARAPGSKPAAAPSAGAAAGEHAGHAPSGAKP